MKKYFSEEQIVELVLTIALANFTNRVNDALLLLPDLGG
jgi:alkylhydroperoxidase family enzyme